MWNARSAMRTCRPASASRRSASSPVSTRYGKTSTAEHVGGGDAGDALHGGVPEQVAAVVVEHLHAVEAGLHQPLEQLARARRLGGGGGAVGDGTERFGRTRCGGHGASPSVASQVR